MKKALLLLAASAFATASFAQTPSTEVKTRDNGTKKIVTEHADGTTTVKKTGRTNVGAAIHNTADAAGNDASKVGHKVSSAFHKGKKKTKSATYKASSKLRKDTKKLDAKTE